MADIKTVPTGADVTEFLNRVEDPARRADCFALVELMSRVTGEPARMWGPAIVGFGTYHYRYDSGREADFLMVGFSPRKASLTLYIVAGFAEYGDLLARLGKHKTGKSCLYVQRLADVDKDVLETMIRRSISALTARWGADG